MEYTKPSNSKATSLSVPATVKLNGVTFKVTSIAANAFKNNKKLLPQKGLNGKKQKISHKII